MVSNIKHLMTVADLEALPYDETKRYELIEGELFVSRAPGLPHQLVLRNLIVELTAYLKQNPVGDIVPGPGAVFSNYDAVIPDIVFVSNARWNSIIGNDRFVAAPDLVIEIVSPGSENRARDLKAKRKLYGKYGVQEYWIVDGQNRSVLIFRLKGNTLDEVSLLRNDDRISSSILTGLTLALEDVFRFPQT
ncbi:MAG TPA: Uma2 family endonuclease, partial [Pyrinomonadaceae bacterium]|nr:Uma2 family endonuclease [Pyrinomonadaceae bacterium]